jgi:hypothetical protein
MRASCPASSMISKRPQQDHPQPDIRCLVSSRAHNRFCVDIREIAAVMPFVSIRWPHFVRFAVKAQHLLSSVGVAVVSIKY